MIFVISKSYIDFEKIDNPDESAGILDPRNPENRSYIYIIYIYSFWDPPKMAKSAKNSTRGHFPFFLLLIVLYNFYFISFYFNFSDLCFT